MDDEVELAIVVGAYDDDRRMDLSTETDDADLARDSLRAMRLLEGDDSFGLEAKQHHIRSNGSY